MVKYNRQWKLCSIVLAAMWAICPAQVLAQVAVEKVIQARQANYFLMGQQMARINATIKGDLAFDKASLQLSAEALDVLGRLVQGSYPPGSDQGSTKAKSEIWKDMARFKQLALESQGEVGKLKETIQRGELAAIKGAYGNASKSCKSCHDVFKAQ